MAPNLEPAQPTYWLYSYSGSTCSARIIIAAKLLGVHLELLPIDLAAGEHVTEAFQAVNPSLAVPVLVIQDVNGQKSTITQSIAILEFLEEVHSFAGKLSLLPMMNRPRDRAKVRELVGIITSDIFPPTNGRIARKVRLIRGEVSDQIEWVHAVMAAGFTSYEAMLKVCAGKYSFGNEITMADIVLVPAYDMAIGYKVDLTPYPTINGVYEELIQLEVFDKRNWAV
jgi:maleylacetoacetate isomerase